MSHLGTHGKSDTASLRRFQHIAAIETRKLLELSRLVKKLQSVRAPAVRRTNGRQSKWPRRHSGVYRKILLCRYDRAMHTSYHDLRIYVQRCHLPCTSSLMLPAIQGKLTNKYNHEVSGSTCALKPASRVTVNGVIMLYDRSTTGSIPQQSYKIIRYEMQRSTIR